MSPATAMVTPSADSAAEFDADRLTQNALQFAVGIDPSERPVAAVVGEENADTELGAVVEFAMLSACAELEPIADAATLSVATAHEAPPATSELRYTTAFW